jgi:4-amino-4-deoxy-L-arabinose transferase-like glycosyltransferase
MTFPSDRIRGFAQRESVLLACLATLAVHLLSLSRRLGQDEGGYAMVARYWLDDGDFLYGPQWVDRPPGLIALFDLAQRLGPYGVRLTASLVAVLLVAALASAAGTVGGRAAAGWAAWAGFALGSSVLLQTQRLNGELAAATFVVVSVAALLRAVRSPGGRARTVLLGAAAGAAATLAVLMKQNVVDGFVFAAVLLSAGLLTRANRLTSPPGRVGAVAVAFGAGAALPAGATLLWAKGRGGVDALAYAMYGFRADASSVMASWSWDAPLHRLGVLALMGVLSGLVLLVLNLAVSRRPRLSTVNPLAWAIAATAAFELAAMLAGGNYWSHYLIALIPMVALAAGLSARSDVPGERWTRRLVVLAAAATALVSPLLIVLRADSASPAYTAGRWVGDSADPDDTIVVLHTHPNVVQASGLRPGYPYSWSLPVRTLDPDLSLLLETLAGPDAPTWVVRWDPAYYWGLDPTSRVDATLEERYRAVGSVCGHAVWLHEGVDRRLAALPPGTDCG